MNFKMSGKSSRALNINAQYGQIGKLKRENNLSREGRKIQCKEVRYRPISVFMYQWFGISLIGYP